MQQAMHHHDVPGVLLHPDLCTPPAVVLVEDAHVEDTVLVAEGRDPSARGCPTHWHRHEILVPEALNTSEGRRCAADGEHGVQRVLQTVDTA